MKKGLIGTLLEYFHTQPVYAEELHRASHQFYGTLSCAKLAEMLEAHTQEQAGDAESLYNEWLVYDFKLKTKATLLDTFIEWNPANLSRQTVKAYEELRVFEYGFFKILSAQPGRVEVESIRRGDRLIVREYSAASGLAPNNVVIARVGMADGRWEFVGAKVHLLPGEHSEQMIRWLRKLRGRLSPKLIYQHWYTPKKDVEDKQPLWRTPDPTMTPSRALEEATAAFMKAGVTPFVTPKQVQDWFRSEPKEPDPNWPVGLILGLADPDQPQSALHELVAALNTFLNYTPRRSLKGKMPVEVAAERRRRGKQPQLRQSMIDFNEHRKASHRAFQAMKRGNMKQTVKAYDRCFELLLENQTTERDIFRLFANKGAVMLAAGNPNGEVFLKIAQDLCPTYDFATKQLDRLEQGDFETNFGRFLDAHPVSRAARKIVQRSKRLPTLRETKHLFREFEAALEKELEQDPAMQYFDWLDQFDIDFSAVPHTPAEITEHRIQ